MTTINPSGEALPWIFQGLVKYGEKSVYGLHQFIPSAGSYACIKQMTAEEGLDFWLRTNMPIPQHIYKK